MGCYRVSQPTLGLSRRVYRLFIGLLLLVLSAAGSAQTDPAATLTSSSAEQAPPNPPHKTLKMGYSHWPPFFIKRRDGRVSGINAEIITAALEPAGYTIEFVDVPWTRGLRGLLTGSLDIIPSASFTRERSQYALFSKPYYQEQYVLYVRAKDQTRFAEQSLAQLLEQGFRLGVFRGTDYGANTMSLLQQTQYKAQITEQTQMDGNYRMIKRDRLDGFIQEHSDYLYHRQNNQMGEDIVPLLDITAIAQHMMFSKARDNSQAVEDFNQGLSQLIADGQYQRIFQTWQGNAWMLPDTTYTPRHIE
ncbi:hypothetical protein GCM10025791_31500 [Halioxenophilus aromaticivorans]|uniref:Solute-binding protein family 3/N-terminal domain-containing protein n=1 Tax=Halioxenophilus aromaticivorans TaxID=1306992 RepID=A0AAV3U5F3_9ALTE